MDEQQKIKATVATCVAYWSSSHVAREDAKEMAAELASHLVEAVEAGKSPIDVVGDDVEGFAEEWAMAHRKPVATGAATTRTSGRSIYALIAIVAIVVMVQLLSPRENDEETSQAMQVMFLGGAVLLAVGEIFTAGFFLLPFAIGAAAAALLAFLEVQASVTFATFVVVSIVALIGLQQYTDNEDGQRPVGANRYVGKIGTVLTPISRLRGTGRVRVETENWRADTDQEKSIDAGMEVRILEVRGTRLVVAPLNESRNVEE